MKFAVITEMKRNFTLIKFIQLLFVLWCIGVVTNAQNDGNVKAHMYVYCNKSIFMAVLYVNIYPCTA